MLTPAVRKRLNVRRASDARASSEAGEQPAEQPAEQQAESNVSANGGEAAGKGAEPDREEKKERYLVPQAKEAKVALRDMIIAARKAANL